jgi:SAM-dependent methyltransferase
VSWIWIVLLVGLVANGVRLRLRAAALRSLPPSSEPVAPEHRFLLAPGSVVDDATRRAASAYARASGLDVLDLVPQDMHVERALYLLRVIAPEAYREDRLQPGRGAGHCMLVHSNVLERAGISAEHELETAAFVRATTQLKSFAPGRADVALAPTLRVGPARSIPAERFWIELFGDGLPIVIGFQIFEYAALALGLVLAPLWGVLALAAFQLQPLLVFIGTPLRPADLPLQPALRSFFALQNFVRTLQLREAKAKASAESTAAQHARYEAAVAGGIERFYEPRRKDCPLCGSEELAVHLRTSDLFHHKPGEFTLERCGGCGHIFQNPRLSIEGLNFYYQDFYDGAWEGPLELIFAAGADSYRARAEMLRGHATPRRWLDVGTGHGHFCLLARQIWPQTSFDGLDMGSSVDLAARKGWIDVAYRSAFPDLAPKLEGSYDVVSMHHYLEHTREPLEELAAASLALKPGGHLLIELPDPESPLGSLLGRRWVAWFQPQHLNFLSIGNLKRTLEKLGFTPLAEERGGAHIPTDFTFWWYSVLENLAPPVGLPWQAPATSARMAWRIGVFIALGPVFVLTLLGDHLIGVALRRSGRPSNTFRVLARKS